ncbi:YlbL family protein [Nocardioides yefusunii]|uniref:PDZ domain-containing protein n=1 Tax=Nocardioides yefusunii TaxID=2500546 RepID=A0ABW1R1L8_9ACTN|nr:PDZ domain-containing protein [Nocardioides yefusunii]
MSQRTLAGVLAVPLVLALWLAALLVPLPYVTYSPGLTVDVLAADDGEPRIEVEGAKTHTDDGTLLLTTVYVTRPERRVNFFGVMEAWFDRDRAVYPYEAVYAPDETRESAEAEAAYEMASSQDTAAAVALRSLGYDVPEVVTVADVAQDMPAAGRLQQGDVIVSVDGTQVDDPTTVGELVDAATPGEPVTFVVERDDVEKKVAVVPATVDGKNRVGVTMGQDFDLPVDVTLNVNPAIGGPSAGLVFALGITDTLTDGSLTGGGTVAGTGTIAGDGAVGPIGGIAQKIAASREQGAGIFLVPAANCAEALGAPAGDMRLVRVESFDDALASVRSWGENHDATLPTCERN